MSEQNNPAPAQPAVCPAPNPGAGDTYFLHATSDAGPAPALTLGQGLPTQVNSLPCKYFWANTIKIGGKYRHPTKGFELSVPPDRASKWLANFQKMKANGVKVPVVADHSVKARDTLGYAIDLRRNGDWVQALIQAIGDDGINTVARNEVSLGITPDFVDGCGNRVGECISHIAATPAPVVPGQGDMIAASRDSGGTPALVFELSTEAPPEAPPPQQHQPNSAPSAPGGPEADRQPPAAAQPGGDASPPRSKPMNEELRKRLLSLTGEPETASDDVLLSRAADELEAQRQDVENYVRYAEGLKGELQLARASADAHAATDVDDETVARLLSRAEAAEAKALELSRNAPRAPDPILMSMYEENVAAKRETAIRCGAISEADAKAFDALLQGADGHPTAIALSMAGETGRPFAFEFWDAVARLGGNPIRTGNAVPRGATPARPVRQPEVNLSRECGAQPRQDGDPADVPPERKAELLAAVGIDYKPPQS